MAPHNIAAEITTPLGESVTLYYRKDGSWTEDAPDADPFTLDEMPAAYMSAYQNRPQWTVNLMVVLDYQFLPQ